ncbi:MAG: hypothetical protein E7058_10590 [Lentisphaerae bacterium]|nr:hypothetical protein [Lentisphaerota bacterium]
MKKYLSLTLLFISAALAAENILPQNSDAKFGLWSSYIAARKVEKHVQFTPAGGFQKSDSIKVDISQCGRISIENLRLYPGRKYRFGAFVRTKNLKAQVCRFIIHNYGWVGDIRSATLPANTNGQWRKVTATGVIPTSPNGEYSFSIYASKVEPGAELEISAPFIEPAVEENEEFSIPENILASMPADGEYGLWSKWIAARKIPVQFTKNGGVDGTDAIKADFSKYRLAIENIKLEPKKIYRFGAFVRTSNIRKGGACLLIHNHRWQRDVRSLPLPADTKGKWVRVEFSTKLPESSNGTYTFNLYGTKLNPDSSIEISAPYIESMELKKKIAPGGNILPGFAATADGEFGLWSNNIGVAGVEMKKFPGAGVGKADFVRATGSIRLNGLKLIANEQYRVSAFIRTNGGLHKESRLIVYDNGWNKEVLISDLPQNTNGEWKKLEKVVTMPTSNNGLYTIIFYLPGGGSYDVCNISIEGVSPRAIAETFPPKSYLEKMRRIYPVTPLLTLVDAGKPQITFSFTCPLPGKLDDYFCRLRLAQNGKWGNWLNFEIPADRRIKTSAPAMTPGKGEINVEIVSKSDNKTILANRYDVKFIAPLPPFKEVRKNNLVTELVNTKLADGKYRFINPRDGWVYIGFRNSSLNATATMNDKVVVRQRKGSDLLETMRYLTRGEHEFTVAGANSADDRLIVRTVPEIMLFPLDVKEKTTIKDASYGIDFFRKYFWPNINTHFLLSAWLPKNDWDHAIGAELDERGIRRIGSSGFGGAWRDLDKMRASFASNRPTMTTEGRACDETEAKADPLILHNYSEACWELTDWNKFIYLWMAGSTGYLHNPAVHAPLISGASHIGNGHGKILMETYVETTPDLKSLEEYYTLVSKHMKCARQSTPDAPERMMLIMSGLIMNGAWNCNAYPQSDIKYAWDYFFHLVATVPEAKGLYGIGCYNIRYTDEENARWLALLFRHYAIEGNTEMLSPKYGIVYNTGAVVNGDFKEGLDGWEVIPAEEGSITPRTIPGYGFTRLRRRGVGSNAGNGNTVVQLTRSAKAPNKLKQTLKNLTPGKLYSFFYVSSDADKQVKNEHGRVDFALEAELEGAEIIPELSYEFRNPPEYLKFKRFEVVTRKIVFRAKAPEVKVTIRDWKDEKTPGAPIGGKRLVNFIGVSAYYAE